MLQNIQVIFLLKKGSFSGMCFDIKDNITKKIFELSDEKYRVFQARLMPNIDIENIVGVRVPILRDYAKQLYKAGEYDLFLNKLPHKYYDENNLHSFLICNIKDFDRCISEIEKFLPYIDNWATCDMLNPGILKKHKPELLVHIKKWIVSDKTYTVRFAIEMLMNHFLDDNFSTEHFEMVSKVRSEEYYVNMMVAWYFATALSKKYDEAIKIIENRVLDRWTHNKTIQKGIESRRLTEVQKEYLRTLKIK